MTASIRIAAVILVYNEERHLKRCLQHISAVTREMYVVDCYSTDSTVEIAKSFNAVVLQHAWVNQAVQFNWALSQLDSDVEWILRVDADEIVTSDLANEINNTLPGVASDVAGVYCGRRMTFQGRAIRWGGVFPIRVLRLFRNGHGECENRWMDEHIKVNGPTMNFRGELLDDNHSSLTAWTAKHNTYSSREVVDLLNLKYGLFPRDTVAKLSIGSEVATKRWIKESVYARLPRGFRAALYFSYRYVARLGFLDGYEGAMFHFLQGFWYRFLVDAKCAEVERYMKSNNVDARIAIGKVLDIKL